MYWLTAENFARALLIDCIGWWRSSHLERRSPSATGRSFPVLGLQRGSAKLVHSSSEACRAGKEGPVWDVLSNTEKVMAEPPDARSNCIGLLQLEELRRRLLMLIVWLGDSLTVERLYAALLQQSKYVGWFVNSCLQNAAGWIPFPYVWRQILEINRFTLIH